MRLNALLLCLLPTFLAAQAFATTQTVQTDGDTVNQDLITAIQTAQPGDVITLAVGTFNVSSPILVPSGVTITGATASGTASLGILPPNSAHVVFNLAGGDTTSYGFILIAGDKNVTFEQLDLSSNHGLIQMSQPGKYSNITITNNNLNYGFGQLSDGSDVYGISATVTSSGVNVTHNYFHDTQGSVRNWCFFFTSNSHFDSNLFYNINDGGQCIDPSGTVTFNGNYGTLIHRMGQECALDARSTYQAIGNTFYDYWKPYNDTEGVSIVGASTLVTISNNFFEATYDPTGGWGVQSGIQAGQPNRFGYAIEATGATGSVVNANTLIGSWAEDVSSDIANLLVTNNSVYGTALWGDFEGEPGIFGYGSIQLDPSNPNIINNDVTQAPAPPANANAGVNLPDGSYASSDPGNGLNTTGSGNPAPTPPSNGPVTRSGGLPNAGNPPLPLTGVVVTVQNSTNCTVSWTSPSSNITSVQINIISTIGRQDFTSVGGTGKVTSLAISQMHPGWLIDFTVVATDSSGQTYQSKPVTASFPGNSLAPWQGLLWGGISVLQTDPYLN